MTSTIDRRLASLERASIGGTYLVAVGPDEDPAAVIEKHQAERSGRPAASYLAVRTGVPRARE